MPTSLGERITSHSSPLVQGSTFCFDFSLVFVLYLRKRPHDNRVQIKPKPGCCSAVLIRGVGLLCFVSQNQMLVLSRTNTWLCQGIRGWFVAGFQSSHDLQQMGGSEEDCGPHTYFGPRSSAAAGEGGSTKQPIKSGVQTVLDVSGNGAIS